MLDDLVTLSLFKDAINPRFLGRICVGILLGGFNDYAPLNVTSDSLINYFDGATIGTESFERLCK